MSEGGFSNAFFSGRIRDTTTKESRKAAESLAMLSNQRRNPDKHFLNSKVGLVSRYCM
jgi:hypothetical protein